MVGMSMTYTLFEWAKENLETLLEAQPESLVVEAMERIQVTFNSDPTVPTYLGKAPPPYLGLATRPRFFSRNTDFTNFACSPSL